MAINARSIGMGRQFYQEEGRMKCPSCRGTMEEGKTTMPYELGRHKVIVVQDIPALICSQCGDAFIESIVLRKVDTLLDTVEKSGMTLGFLEYREAA